MPTTAYRLRVLARANMTCSTPDCSGAPSCGSPLCADCIHARYLAAMPNFPVWLAARMHWK